MTENYNPCYILSTKKKKPLLHFFLDRRDGKAVINSHTQSAGIGIRTSIMTSGLTIFPVELGRLGHIPLLHLCVTYILLVIKQLIIIFFVKYPNG